MFIPAGIDGSQSGSSLQASWELVFSLFRTGHCSFRCVPVFCGFLRRNQGKKTPKTWKICQVQHLPGLELGGWRELKWFSRF